MRFLKKLFTRNRVDLGFVSVGYKGKKWRW